jgi:tetraacyldisaccharide 4'-kinase
MLILKPVTSFLSLIIDFVYRVRRLLFGHHVFSSTELIPKTISVGNLELGGTGKTPFTIWLATFLEDLEYTGVILTRGYKRESVEKSSVQLTPENNHTINVSDVGDEPLLISRKLQSSSVVVGADRLKGYFERPVIHTDDFVLLDDGHQHLRIRRDLNIILINSSTYPEKFKCVPAGSLREGLTSLMCADIIIFTKCEQSPSENELALKRMIHKYTKPDSVWGRVKFSPSYFQNIKTKEKKLLIDLSSKECGAFCGIAKPDHFYNTLDQLNLNIIRKVTFDNHHKFKESSYRKINKLENVKSLICTEKDAVKIDPQRIKGDIFSLVNQVVFLEGESKIKDKIKKILTYE